jgi:cysteine-rich repeat protein
MLQLGPDGPTWFRVHTTGELSWATVEIQTPGWGTMAQKLYDAAGDWDESHQPTNLCTAGAQVGVWSENGMGLAWSGGGYCGMCGDGTVNVGEQCDDWNAQSGDGCSSACTYETCASGQSSRAAQGLSFTWLGRSCASAADIYFTVNGVEVGRTAMAPSCDCLPGAATLEVTDPTLLSLVTNGTDVFKVFTGGELAWANVQVRTLAGAWTQKVFDFTNNYDPAYQPLDICATGARAGVAAASAVTGFSYWGGGLCTTCGNGIVEPFEQCDDGNTAPDDGCTATCQLAP